MVVAMVAASMDVEASCAICGAPASPECPHEGQRLNLAVDQAMERWAGVQRIREWVVIHARNHVISTFQELKSLRWQHHLQYLETLPCYSLYKTYQGHPPLQPAQLHQLRSQIQQADAIFKHGIDRDWQQSCLRYPEVLDYYFSLVEISWPDGRDESVVSPVFGVPPAMQMQKETRRVKGSSRRDSVDDGGSARGHGGIHKKRDKRGRTPPPTAPMAPHRR